MDNRFNTSLHYFWNVKLLSVSSASCAMWPRLNTLYRYTWAGTDKISVILRCAAWCVVNAVSYWFTQ